jgi:hypothetical protein
MNTQPEETVDKSVHFRLYFYHELFVLTGFSVPVWPGGYKIFL